MTASKIFFLSILSLYFLSCSTPSQRNIILRDMFVGAAVGALVAQTKDNNKAAYTSMYAGIGAATVGAVSVYLNTSREDEFKKENQNLKTKIEQFQKQLEPQLIQKGSSLFSSPLPKEVSSLVDPGEWRRYKLDQWVQDPNQPNTWYRQIEMFEIIPPATR